MPTNYKQIKSNHPYDRSIPLTTNFWTTFKCIAMQWIYHFNVSIQFQCDIAFRMWKNPFAYHKQILFAIAWIQFIFSISTAKRKENGKKLHKSYERTEMKDAIWFINRDLPRRTTAAAAAAVPIIIYKFCPFLLFAGLLKHLQCVCSFQSELRWL